MNKENELKSLNDELNDLLTPPSEEETPNFVEDTSQVDAESESPEFEQQHDMVPIEHQNKIFAQIDEMAASLYSELAKVDSLFGNIALQFSSLADSYSNSSGNKNDDSTLSDDEKVALIFEAASLATRGLGNIVNAFKVEIQKQKILPILRKEAEAKGDFIRTQIDSLSSIYESNLILYNKKCFEFNLHFDNEQLNDEVLYNKFRNDHIFYLGLVRSTLFHLRFCQDLVSKFDLWLNGQFGDTSMVDYGDINRELLYDCIYTYPNEDNKRSAIFIIKTINEQILKDLKRAMGEFTDGEEGFIPCNIYPVIIDRQLMATFLANEEIKVYDELSEIDNKYTNELKSELLSNEAYTKYTELASEYAEISGSRILKALVIILNSILLTAISGILSFRNFDQTWMKIGVIAIVLLLSSYIAKHFISKQSVKYKEKLSRLELHIQNTMNKIAGELPKSNVLSIWNDSITKVILLGIAGAVVGSFFFPPIGTIIGALIFTSFVGSTKEIKSNGSDYKEIKTGKGWISYLIFTILIAVICNLLM